MQINKRLNAADRIKSKKKAPCQTIFFKSRYRVQASRQFGETVAG